MEPCLFRHGKARPPSRLLCRLERLQWSHVFSDMVSATLILPYDTSNPLQWSHVFSDMVRLLEEFGVDESLRLQWSHVFSDMVRELPFVRDLIAFCSFNGAMSFQTW
ncbi:protein of unknown function [Methanoculleus bourgensis]|uniref:Uncharacterized protein n=1 Tax=Methanoculleus bourgensis TaxID=83986 RepID=A0A0X8XYI8_9EURY|nr:protein of unknown function [Methanoculleus bourgensis]